jgi:hypothetical protein
MGQKKTVYRLLVGKPGRMLRRVALVRTNVSEECMASIIRVKIISELGTTSAVTTNRSCKEILTMDDGGDRFLRKVGSYKSHTASFPR